VYENFFVLGESFFVLGIFRASHVVVVENASQYEILVVAVAWGGQSDNFPHSLFNSPGWLLGVRSIRMESG